MTSGELITWLLARSAITDYTSTRIYEDVVPEFCDSTTSAPVVRVSLLDRTQEQNQSGVSTADYAVYQIDVYAETGVSRWNVQAAIEDELDGYLGTIGTSYVTAEMTGIDHDYEKLADDRDEARFRSIMTFRFVIES